MNMKQKLLAAAIALSALTSVAVVPAANAEVEVAASVGVSNMYYWRGFDLGGGAAVFGDVNVSASGFYAGAWTSSGDEVMGTEYDLYFGYGGEIGDFSYGLNYTTYIYPEADEALSPFDAAEAILTLGYGPAYVSYHYGLEDFEDSSYLKVGANFGKFGLAYGVHMNEESGVGNDEYSHLDLSYAYNDNLSFMLGVVVDDVDDKFNDEAKFIVSLSLPIQ
jgi:uncharacterized protein (TIGR02001 family)